MIFKLKWCPLGAHFLFIICYSPAKLSKLYNLLIKFMQMDEHCNIQGKHLPLGIIRLEFPKTGLFSFKSPFLFHLLKIKLFSVTFAFEVSWKDWKMIYETCPCCSPFISHFTAGQYRIGPISFPWKVQFLSPKKVCNNSRMFVSWESTDY